MLEGEQILRTTASQWWDAEAAVFAAYWDSPRRSVATDLAWLRRQCYKELYDGVVPRGHDLKHDSRPIAELAREIREEATHFEVFADVYERFRPADTAPLTAALVRDSNWPENTALGELRARHRRDHGIVGAFAGAVTEGGGCSLFTSAMARAGHGDIDDAIAAACGRVYDDEREHVETAFAAIARANLDRAEHNRLVDLVAEQSEARIAMREAQFGRPRC